jgi:UDP-4-amino-4,6-dideoxy-N-acetyl-beta-L-altrosamine transaminase
MNMTPHKSLPYGCHQVDDDDVAAVVKVLRGELIAGGGPVGQALESAFAERVGARYGVVCNSGTAALHLAALALGLEEGDVVIVPTLTFLATANAARYVGAEVIFADVDGDTGLITETALDSALDRAGGKARAFFPVHLNGHCADMARIGPLAARRGLQVIEDACHAMGATYSGDGVNHLTGACAHSVVTTFSMHPVKAIAMGEGGIVTTNDPALAEAMRRLRSHGMVRDPVRFEQPGEAFASGGEVNSWYYEMPEIGFNYRASDINSALGLSQLRKLDVFLARRRALADRYDAALVGLAPLLRPVPRQVGGESGWHLYAVLIDFATAGIDREHLMALLRDQGIGTQVHYLPVHRQPYYLRRYGELTLPGADAYYSRCLSLPLFPGMADEDVDFVVENLKQILTT